MEKKTYMTPDVEVIKFEVEDIMMASSVSLGTGLDWINGAEDTGVKWGTVSYSDLLK